MKLLEANDETPDDKISNPQKAGTLKFWSAALKEELTKNLDMLTLLAGLKILLRLSSGCE